MKFLYLLQKKNPHELRHDTKKKMSMVHGMPSHYLCTEIFLNEKKNSSNLEWVA